MKKILFLLTLNTWLFAGMHEHHSHPKFSNTSLLKIINEGWKDENSSVHIPLVKHFPSTLKKVLGKMKNPVEAVEKTEKDPFPLPHIEFTKSDYLSVFAYVKYLESQKELDKAIDIIALALNGLDGIEGQDAVSMIYHHVIETSVVNSINQSLSHTQFSAKQKARLKEVLAKTLMLDTDIFNNVLKYETTFMLYAFKKEKISKEIIKNLSNLYENMNTKYINSNSKEALENIEKTYLAEEKKYKEAKVDKKEYTYFYMYRPLWKDTKLDLLNQITKNKMLLERL